MQMSDTSTAPERAPEEKQKKRINAKLRAARIRQLWPIKMAAHRAGVSVSTYIRWEQNQRTPQLINLQALCDAFQLSAEELGYGELMAEEGIEVEPRSKRIKRLNK